MMSLLVACVLASACGDDPDPEPLPDGKELVAFQFRAADNAGLKADVPAVIAGSGITATVPTGTDVGALVARFETTGVEVSVGGKAQTSGVSANNFSGAVRYRVTAEDGTTRDYTVAVTVAPATAKELTAFAFLAKGNTVLAADVMATISGTAIAATVPSGTKVDALVATFTTTGAGVTVGEVAQVSGNTANNFTSPVRYTVKAADGSTRDYTVMVAVAPASAKAITEYRFLSSKNPSIGGDVTARITGGLIEATVPAGTRLGALVASFSTTGERVTVGDEPQASGVTANDFSRPVAYTVSAADGSQAVFTVRLTVAFSEKEITDYRFLLSHNPSLGADVVATIRGNMIEATVPFGTDVGGMVATFTRSAAATVTVGDRPQTSGVTPNDFRASVAYTVAAPDGTRAVFTVVVTIAKPEKEITDYRFLAAKNPSLRADVTAVITNGRIEATVPFGTDLTALIATFTTSTGATATVRGNPQTSGVTPNDFGLSVPYDVTAADSASKQFLVVVTVSPPESKIVEYRFLAAANPTLGADVIATITGNAITATVPAGTEVTGLVATFTLSSGAVAHVGATLQVSGVTTNNFSSTVRYTVTANGGLREDFTVAVTVGGAAAVSPLVGPGPGESGR